MSIEGPMGSTAPPDPWAPPSAGDRPLVGRRVAVALIATATAAAVGIGSLAWVVLTHQPTGTLRGAVSSAPTAGPSSSAPSPLDDGPVALDRGSVILSDGFDHQAGWKVGSLPSGTTYSYEAAGYTIRGVGELHHWAYAPLRGPVQALSASITATISAHASTGSGFGVICLQESLDHQLRYEFLVTVEGRWFVERGEGPPSATNPNTVVAQGRTTARPGAGPLTIQGVCLTQAMPQRTRLVFFVGAKQVIDVVDVAAHSTNAGWRGGVLTASTASAPSTVIATRVILRDAG